MIYFALGLCFGVLAETLGIIIFLIFNSRHDGLLRKEREKEKKEAARAQKAAKKAKREQMHENMRQIGRE